MSLTHLQLRKLFSDFWRSKGHKEVPAIPLVPKDDPTTLFTGSGMQQLVPYLLGEPHPLGEKLFNIQPCFRSQDIEEVGDNRHDTFFEMAGNWSLGTYFKIEQLSWLFEFLVEILKLDPKKLYVTVFEGDSRFKVINDTNKSEPLGADLESISIWKNVYKKYGIEAQLNKQIFAYSSNKNWWTRASSITDMPVNEPGGPDSEVFYEFTQVKHDPKFGKNCHPNCDCGRFLEIGNSVFMQFKKNRDDSFSKLPSKNVDFGGGFERLLMAIENENDIFQTGVFKKIIQSLESLTQLNYIDKRYTASLRIIADHVKISVLLIKNGVLPGNKLQGYVLRRLLRRASVKLRILMNKTVTAIDFEPIIQSVIGTYGKIYFDKNNDFEIINLAIKKEIDRFTKSLDRGLKELQKLDKVDGKVAFNLYQSYGFPWELSEELAKEKGEIIDRKQFQKEFEKHKNLSRTASSGMFKGGLADNSEQVLKYHTATHLLHQALFDVLGNDVRQEGSNITGERLRFDFSAPRKLTDEEKIKVQEIINAKIKESLPVSFKIIPREEAYKIGARSFFREKYPDMVKVYSVGDYSKEFCGGPHVKNTKEIGKIEIYKFEKIGSNLYRIYAK